jgi:hypothetical protein
LTDPLGSMIFEEYKKKETDGNTEYNIPQVIYRCLTTDSLPRGYLGQLFGLRRVLELDNEHRDSRFIPVRALDHDRVIALCPVGVSLCIRLIMLCCLLLQGCPSSLFISIEKSMVRLQS